MNFKSVLFLALLLSFSQLLIAQVDQENRKMSQGVHPALTMMLPAVDAKDVDDVWKDYVKDFYDTKTKRIRKTDEYFSDDAEITAIGGSNTVDLYATFDEVGEDTEMCLWVDLGGAFLASAEHPNRYAEAEKMMLRFGIEVAKFQTNEELEAEEKKLKKIQSELSKLERANKRYHKNIEEAKERIKKAEENIVENEQSQEATKKLIEEQLKAVELVKKKLSDL
ncbi:MAG: hypothetical protein AAF798_15495 [Bacteroidota bacterium]